MKEKLLLFLQKWWALLALLALLPVYTGIALNNERAVDYVNNGFFTFWLAGQMTWSEAHPYSPQDWVGGHHDNGAIWIPNQIFPYPLPLSLVTSVLGLFPIEVAYIAWGILAQVFIAVCILWLAQHWEGLNRQLYALFVLVAAILNGNIFLGLMTGTLAALFLVFLTLTLYFFETRRPLLAGLALAGLALKPPLLTVAALIGIWWLVRREWRAIAGTALGGLALLGIGLLQDPQWVQKFIGAGNSLLNMRIGNQPTLLSYTRLACNGEMTCAMSLYAVLAFALVAVFAWLVWRKRDALTPLMALSAAIPLGVLLPPYIWSYDYVLLILPLCYIVFELVRRRASYLYATLFLLAIDVLSIIGLTLFWMNPESTAITIQRDMWSIWVCLLVLVAAWWMVFSMPIVEKSPAE